MHRATRCAAALTALLCSLSCAGQPPSGQQQDSDSAQLPAAAPATQAQLFAGLPQLDALSAAESPARAAAQLDTQFRMGDEAAAFSTAAEAGDQFMQLDAGGSVLAWALYSFDSPYEPLDVSVLVDGPPGCAWLGVSDYASGRWDFHGPFTAAQSFALDARHASPAGDFHCVVVAQADCHLISLGFNQRQPAEQQLFARLRVLPAVLTEGELLTLDASESFGATGGIVRHEWDLDGDGEYESDTGAQPFLLHYPEQAGIYSIGLRVTEQAGASAVDTGSLYVHGFLEAQLVADRFDSGTPSSMAVVDGHPAIVYYELDGSEDIGSLRYIRALDARGTAWGTDIELDQTGAGPGKCSLKVCGGRPAAAYRHMNNEELRFVRASDSAGSAWGEPVVVDSAGDVGYACSLVAEGLPFISYYDTDNDDLLFVRGISSAGADWTEPEVLDSEGDKGVFSSIAIVDGQPAVAYFDGDADDLRFIRSADLNGALWNEPQIIVSAGDAGSNPCLAVLHDRASISFYDRDNERLRFIRALDSEAQNWGAAVSIDGTAAGGHTSSLALVGGRPAVVYSTIEPRELRYARALQGDGSGWGPAISIGGEQNAHSGCLVVLADGLPAISYADRLPLAEDLYYAAGF